MVSVRLYFSCVLHVCDLFGETICNMFGCGFILLLNVMEVFSVEEVEVLCWIYHVWSSKAYVCCACDSSVHLDVPSMGFVCVYVCRKLSPHLGV